MQLGERLFSQGPAARGALAMVLMALSALLAGCAGTIKQDERHAGDVSAVVGVARVDTRLSPEATRQQADNPQFSREELANYVRRRLEARSLIGSSARHHVDVVITDIRVRSAFSAIMFGFMAGDDHVTGVVRIIDAGGNTLRSFDVNASYAFGGLAGGQDGMRMTWLYDKFSEMAVGELEKLVKAPAVAGPAGAAASAATAAMPTAPAAPATGTAVVTAPMPVPAPAEPPRLSNTGTTLRKYDGR